MLDVDRTRLLMFTVAVIVLLVSLQRCNTQSIRVSVSKSKVGHPKARNWHWSVGGSTRNVWSLLTAGTMHRGWDDPTQTLLRQSLSRWCSFFRLLFRSMRAEDHTHIQVLPVTTHPKWRNKKRMLCVCGISFAQVCVFLRHQKHVHFRYRKIKGIPWHNL
jgi:hypothetical protein